MPLKYSKDKTKGILDSVRPHFPKDRGTKAATKSVKMQARVNFVDGHLMTADIRHGAFRIITDEPSLYGGHDLAPAPLEYFVAGFALCEAAQYLWQIVDMGLDVDDIALEVKTLSSWSPLLADGVEDAVGPEFSRVSVSVWIESPEPRERIEELLLRSARQCPAHASLEKPMKIDTKLHLNEGIPGVSKPELFTH